MKEDVVVFCDKPSDVKLFNLLKGISPVLAHINNQNVRVLPDRKALAPDYITGFGPLLDYDRADYYFCYNGAPFFVIEMTEHGYTGDQCMQRFARIAKTAEMGIPFVYFAPTSRTRYDELDNDNPSYRNVSADMYEGFVRLTEIFSTPIVAVQWETGENGIPLILGQDDPQITGISTLFGLVDSLFGKQFDKLITRQSIIEADEIQPYILNTKKLSQRANVRESEVRKENLAFNAIADIIGNPSKTYQLMPKEYFYKGKSFKLLARMSIDQSNIKKVILPNNAEISVDVFFENYRPVFDKYLWLYYYSGYQWRSEPNVGIVTNIDITKCRTQYGKTINDRNQLLCVHWPRIFWNKDSDVRDGLLNEISDIHSSALLQSLINEAHAHTGKSPNVGIIGSGTKTFGAWSDRATVARIYRSVCDLIILNDAVIIGNKWGGCFAD